MADIEATKTLEDQVQVILRLLEGKQLKHEGPIFDTALKWIRNFPVYIDPALKERLKRATCQTFELSEAQLISAIEGLVIPNGNGIHTLGEEDKLRSLLPQEGWFSWYDEFTRYNEAPLSYHIFSSLCVLGASLGRRVWLDMGHFKIWPNYCAILIGPTGRVKKTTAADIARDLIHRHSLCPIMSDEPTPQALAKALTASGHQFFYAPEMSVFFGKEQYKQGMIPKILRMLDSPAVFEIDTIARGKETVLNLAITLLGCTTPSLLTTSMPAEVTSSGFMNRFILVVENNTERVFPRPRKGLYEEKLNAVIERFKAFNGEMHFAPGVEAGWWNTWYRQRKKQIAQLADDTLVEVLERTPGHLLRTAMLMHLAQCDDMHICERCLQSSSNLLDHIEKNAPGMIRALKQSTGSGEADFVMQKLFRLGGAADHSTLLRAVSTRMGAAQLKLHIKTLEERGSLKVGRKGMGQYYISTEHEEHQ